MRAPQPEEYQHSIVIRGDLNPAIFQPSWFAAAGLIGKQQADAAKVEIIHRDVAVFSADWLNIEVTQDRFHVYTMHEQYTEPLQDLVLGTFSLLNHTPLRIIGINLTAHFRLPSVEVWNEAGHKLVPKGLWEGILNKPGMKSVIVEESERRDGHKGYIRLTVEPSRRVPLGLFFGVNDHIEINEEGGIGSENLINVLREQGRSSLKMSEDMMYTLLERLTK